MSTASLYRDFRRHSPFMLVGHNAEQAIKAARILSRWRELEAAGLVKIEAEPDSDPDPSFYDTWEHLSERSRRELKRAYCEDCSVVTTSYRCNDCGEWKDVDSICGCSGYDDPCSPFENAYVIGLMETAIARVDK